MARAARRPGASRAIVVLSTAPDARTARRIARALVEEGLCACVSIVPALRSIYRWEGKLEEAREELLIAKTTRARLPALERRLAELHPYDLPELLVLPAEGGGRYLAWLEAATS